MPDTEFFATFNDLEPTLREIESNLKLKYVCCTGDLFSETSDPVIFNSLIDPEVPDFDKLAFLVLEASTRVFVDPVPSRRSEPENPEFPIVVEKGKPYLFFSPSEIIDATFIDGDQRIPGKAFRMGSVYTSSANSVAGYSEHDYSFYRGFAHPIRACLTRHGYLYGREALIEGEKGARYVWGGAANVLPRHEIWTHQDTMDRSREEQAIAPRALRLGLIESCSVVEHMGYEVSRDEHGNPKIRRNAQNDEPLLNFAATMVDSENFDNLTIPTCYFSESQIELSSFVNSDLKGSTLIANDWLDCNFANVDLSNSDIGGSVYYFCSFANADLSFADLRGSRFFQCDFTQARLRRAQLTRKQLSSMNLSLMQRMSIRLRRTVGPTHED